MNINQSLQSDPLTLIAIQAIVNQHAGGIDLNDSIAGCCQQADVNRSQVYQRKDQLIQLFDNLQLPGPGRPSGQQAPPDDAAFYQLKIQVLRYQVEHPGAKTVNGSGRCTYGDQFKCFVLDLLDQWPAGLDRFCQAVELPIDTVLSWKKSDIDVPVQPAPLACDCGDNPVVEQIVYDFTTWQGSVRGFLPYEAQRVNLPINQIRRVLRILGLIDAKKDKPPRYRGATHKVAPGKIVVTDGKQIDVELTSGGKPHFNWQGIIDQCTSCHTATVVTETETAQAVEQAFEQSCDFIGRTPEAVVHDNKPIHQNSRLRNKVQQRSRMIAATAAMPTNKAGIEGEFGKWEQAVGPICLDDSSTAALIKSAVHETIRAYCAGINHAGRAEFEGQSRLQVLRETCPDAEKDRAFIDQLHQSHSQPRTDVLPTQPVAMALLDQAFEQFDLQGNDADSKIRIWLSSRYTPEAICQAIAIFGAEYEKGRLHNQHAHRYLVKLVQNCQTEIDLRIQEQLLYEFFNIQRNHCLQTLENDYQTVVDQCRNQHSVQHNLAFELSELAVFGSIIIQRAFWEDKLKQHLATQPEQIPAVCRHIRRLYEAQGNDRFQLISRLIKFQHQL